MAGLRRRPGRRRAFGVATLMALALAVTGCTGGSDDPTPVDKSPTAKPTLTFGVFGSEAEITAFQTNVDIWNTNSESGQFKLESWPTRTAMRVAIEGGEPVPDVFLASRYDLAWLLEQGYTQPVDELLDDRGVDFGDTYSRDALQAFGYEDRLQCMPYGVTPTVIYYNKDLVNFEQMRNRGLDVPDVDATGWSFDQFTAAAEFASRPRRGTKGVHIDATLTGLAPFIYSGGGAVFDDEFDPTTLTFSSDDTRSALERTLELLRNPLLTLDEAQLDRASAVRWFERGKLGMIAGDRSLTPRLRKQVALNFDVMPMPTLDGAATVGDVTGLCLSADTTNAPVAADFMVHELSGDSVAEVARTGYLDPANLQVALTDDFLQPLRRPAHATFFNTSVGSMRLAPTIDTLPELGSAVETSLEQLVYGVGVLDLDGLTAQIDEESRTVLSPEGSSESPSEDAAE